MKKKTIFISVVIIIAVACAIYLWLNHSHHQQDELLLNGNVDIRQVSLSFDGNGRIEKLDAEEGDQVRSGQVLGRLDTESLQLQAAAAQAEVQVQTENLLRLKNGARLQEILQAKSRVHAAEAKAIMAKNELARLKAIAADTAGKGASAQELDQANSTSKVASAQLAEYKEALRLLQEGSRKEDVAGAQAQLQSAKAKLRLLQHQINLGVLIAPTAGVIRSRLLEPGDMASAQKPVFTLALTQPKWIRAYVKEGDLGKVKSGMRAEVVTDSAPNRPIAGKVGYISSVAEFTPKYVQTEELRTSLVYEIRILVNDAGNQLRLGQPATVKINLSGRAGS